MWRRTCLKWRLYWTSLLILCSITESAFCMYMMPLSKLRLIQELNWYVNTIAKCSSRSFSVAESFRSPRFCHDWCFSVFQHILLLLIFSLKWLEVPWDLLHFQFGVFFRSQNESLVLLVFALFDVCRNLLAKLFVVLFALALCFLTLGIQCLVQFERAQRHLVLTLEILRYHF